MIINEVSKSTFKNILGLFDASGIVLVDETSDFLDLSRAELASAIGVTVDQIRPDRLSPKAVERLTMLAAALEYVAETFEGDITKVRFWIRTPNLNFGGISPFSLIMKGKYKKVIDFITSAQAAVRPARK